MLVVAMKRYSTLIFLLIVQVGCNPSTEYRFEVAQGDSTGIVSIENAEIANLGLANESIVVSGVFSNRTSSVIYVRPCGGGRPTYTIEKLVGGAWVDAVLPVCSLKDVPPTILNPGETIHHEIIISTNIEAYAVWQVPSLPGTYRVLYGLYETHNEEGLSYGHLLPDEARTSNIFKIAK